MGKAEYNKYLKRYEPLSRSDIEIFYIKPLERMLKNGIRVIENNGRTERIILSSKRDDFYIDFEESGAIVVNWQGEVTRDDFDYTLHTKPQQGTEAYEDYMMWGEKYHIYCRAESILKYIDTIKDIACDGDRPQTGESVTEQLYIDPLKKIFKEELRVEKEKNITQYIILDGEKEEFFLSFYDDGNRIDLFWEPEQFIFDRGRELLGYDESCDNIVYENKQDLSDNEKMSELIINIIKVLNGAVFLNKCEKKTGLFTNFSRVEKLEYVIYTEKCGEEHREYTFGNIKIVVN